MNRPLMLSTWTWGTEANRAAWPRLISGEVAGAIEAGARHAEEDLANHTVGRGGYPDASGRVSLDAAIMLAPDRHGAAACVREHACAISIARAVMEKTPHRLLVGTDADAFAASLGLPSSELLTDDARRAWSDWKASGRDVKLANIEEQFAGRAHLRAGHTNHDTIGLIAIDASGTIGCGTTTSGLAFKLPGRVGDSPLVGCGLYCDPSIGAAVCTGRGELAMGVCGAMLAVESLRAGNSAQEAAEIVIRRIAQTHSLGPDDQLGIIVARPDGSFGASSLIGGFSVALKSVDREELIRVEPLDRSRR